MDYPDCLGVELVFGDAVDARYRRKNLNEPLTAVSGILLFVQSR